MTSLSPPHLLAIIIIFIFIITTTNSQQFITSEQTTLLNLKQAWSNPPSLSHWTSTSSPCTWPEITCINNTTVVELHLVSKQLIGYIPSFICDLKNLQTLLLHDNYITGEFPRVLYNCTKLTELDISQNMFVGALPDDIDSFSQLKTAEFGGNNFTGDIPRSIGNLTALTSLLLYQNLFNGSVPSEIGNLSNLETLGLAYNEFADPVIPYEFGKLNKLKTLWMPMTNLIGKIPKSFANLVNLELLDLSLNYLEGEILPELFLLHNLDNMFLYKNNFSGELPAVIQSTNLTQIDVSMNRLTGSIPEDVGKLVKLEVLNLYSNQFSGQIPVNIAKIETLRVFKVFRNNLTGELPPDLGKYSKLESFEVSDNKLTGKLPEDLCAGGVLTGVVAFSNNLTGELPKSLQSCDAITAIQVYNNSLSGEIPSGIWTLQNISSLRLSGNSFSGELPSKVAWNLSRLEISDNKFSGGIPPGILSWVKLNVFKASNNMFSGEIPPEFTSLSELSVLYLDGNSLSGELPSEIKSWNSLTVLNLARNKLSGQIPSSFGSLQDLLELDLSENQLSGQVPSELNNIRLTSLNLSSNKLTGRIPSSFDNLAFKNSFLNTNLCSKSQISNLHNCNSKDSHSKKFSPKIIAMIVVLSVFVLLSAVMFLLFVFRDYQKKKPKKIRTMWKLTSFHKMDFTEANILSCMTEANVIGTGGAGKVYRIAVGPPRGYVAVKRILNNRKLDQNLENEFTSEVQILGSIRHSNIVKLLCCLSSQNSKLLVYEYLVHQSLDKWLHGKKRKPEPGLVPGFVLDWPRRLQIAIGAAQGLCYMHHDCSPPIVHRDVKSSNILLDSEFNAKIADFGLAKILEKQKPGEAGVSSVVGSMGYFAPEYAYTTRINERIDVYSFGVVLLELVTGREASEGDKDTNLAEWAWKHYGEGDSVAGALDPEISTNYMEEMSTVFKLGLICTSTLPSSRPSMKDVLEILRRCNPLDHLPEEMKQGREEFDVAPLLKSESYITSYHETEEI